MDSSFLGEIKRNRLILTLYLPSVIMAICQGILLPVLPLFAKELDIAYWLVGLVVAAASIGTLLGDLPAGMLLRTLGTKRSMILGIGLSMLSTTALFWTTSVLVVILLRLLSGFGLAMFSISRLNYMADVVSVPNRGRVISLLGGTFRLGRLAGPIIGGIVAASYGLNAPFLVYGVGLAVGLLAVVVFTPTIERVPLTDQSKSESLKHHLLSTVKANSHSLKYAGTAQLFGRMLRRSRGIIIPLYGADVLGLDVQTIGYILSISALIDVSLFLPAGWIMDHKGRKVAIVPAFVILSVGMLMVPFTETAVGLTVAAIIMGIGNGLSSGAFQILGTDLAPEEGRGEFLGAWRLIGDVGASGGPLVVGAVAGILVLSASAIVMGAAGLISAGIMYFKVPETLRIETDP